eukprot:2544034-Prymnesium_polylepis.1
MPRLPQLDGREVRPALATRAHEDVVVEARLQPADPDVAKRHVRRFAHSAQPHVAQEDEVGSHAHDPLEFGAARVLECTDRRVRSPDRRPVREHRLGLSLRDGLAQRCLHHRFTADVWRLGLDDASRRLRVARHIVHLLEHRAILGLDRCGERGLLARSRPRERGEHGHRVTFPLERHLEVANKARVYWRREERLVAASHRERDVRHSRWRCARGLGLVTARGFHHRARQQQQAEQRSHRKTSSSSHRPFPVTYSQCQSVSCGPWSPRTDHFD